MTDIDIQCKISPVGFGRYHVTVSFPADRYGARLLLTGRRFGKRRAERLAGRLAAQAMNVIVDRWDEPS